MGVADVVFSPVTVAAVIVVVAVYIFATSERIHLGQFAGKQKLPLRNAKPGASKRSQIDVKTCASSVVL